MHDIYKKPVIPPNVQQLQEIDQHEQSRMDDLEIECSDSVKEKGGLFIAYAVKTKSIGDVRRAYKRIRLMHPSADHVVSAYTTKFNQGGDDDGEIGAALRLQKFLDDRNAKERSVFMVRYFGGQFLGIRRFAIIEKAVKEAIDLLDESLAEHENPQDNP